jgi:hypothetical protein
VKRVAEQKKNSSVRAIPDVLLFLLPWPHQGYQVMNNLLLAIYKLTWFGLVSFGFNTLLSRREMQLS